MIRKTMPLSNWIQPHDFDTIGNRETATRDSTTEAYTPNRLNQINSIDHGGLLHLLGTADASATVLVDGSATSRSGNLFYGTVSGANTFESFSILGTLTGAGDGGSDAVARVDREVYIPAGATSRTNDASGNLTEDAEWTYTWDAENRLVQMETRPSVVTAGAPHRRLTFEYDSQSRRTSKTIEHWDAATSSFILHPSTLFLWNDWLLSTELEADTFEPIRSYTWGHDLAGTREQTGGVGGLALVKHHKNGEVSVPLYTTNGNIRGYWEIDADELVAEFEYGSFGELLRATGEKSGTHAFRFSTKYEDTETGLLYYGYRFFDSDTGRWLNRDPIEEEGGINLYAFTLNNPITHVDSLGQFGRVILPGVPSHQWARTRFREQVDSWRSKGHQFAAHLGQLFLNGHQGQIQLNQFSHVIKDSWTFQFALKKFLYDRYGTGTKTLGGNLTGSIDFSVEFLSGDVYNALGTGHFTSLGGKVCILSEQTVYAYNFKVEQSDNYSYAPRGFLRSRLVHNGYYAAHLLETVYRSSFSFRHKETISFSNEFI